MMALDKRAKPTDPLTEHDVAERLDRAATRVLSILMDVRQTPGLYEQVKNSRFLTAGLLDGLSEELHLWLEDA